MIKVVIASSLTVLREGAKQILFSQDDIDVIAEVAHPRELFSNREWLDADVLLIVSDSALAEGQEYLADLRQRHPTLHIMVLLRFPTPQQVLSTLRLGVKGLLSANSAANHLPTAVRAISSGRGYLNEDLSRWLIPEVGVADKDCSHSSLTQREMQVFRKLAAGEKVTQIASQLGISNKTVSTHKMRLMEKMRMTSFSQVVQYAIAYGLCDNVRGGEESHSPAPASRQ